MMMVGVVVVVVVSMMMVMVVSLVWALLISVHYLPTVWPITPCPYAGYSKVTQILNYSHTQLFTYPIFKYPHLVYYQLPTTSYI